MAVRIKKSTGKKVNHSIALTQYYMTQSFQDPITLDMLAKICDINKYYLAYLFKKEIGMAPINYLNDVRIKEAKIMLETTDLTIGEIANITGFSSQSFFTQAFN